MIAPARETNYRLAILKQPSDWDDPCLRSRWDEITKESENINAIYGSAVWFDLLREIHKAEELGIVVAYDSSGDVVGLAPILFQDYPFQFYVSRYPIVTRQLKAAHLLGSVPMLPADSQISAQLADALLNASIDCVYMDTVPAADPFLKRAIHTWRRSHLVYAPGGSRPWHLLKLPSTSQEYLSRMSSRKRSKLRNATRRLAESANGEPQLMRIDSAEQVRDFLADAVNVSRNSWQHGILGNRIKGSDDERVWGEGLAKAGLLRSYVLKCGPRPCAFVVGHQFNGVFHYAEIGYDREFSEYSPGTILLHLLIQDLCDYKPPALLNFGMGDADYKQRFGNLQMEDSSIIVLRKTLRNYILVSSHALFRRLVVFARRIVKGRRKYFEAFRLRRSGVNPSPVTAFGSEARAKS